MAYICRIHPKNPQQRLIDQVASLLRDGGLVALPTDCTYVLACHIHDKEAMDRLRQIRAIGEKHLLTLICQDLSDIGSYAKVDNSQYRFLRAATPGAYTFILDASKELPRRVLCPKRKTIGVRVPDHPMVSMLLSTLGDPLISSSLILPSETEPMTDAEEILDILGDRIDMVIDSGTMTTAVTTVLDLTTVEYSLVRQGLGDVDSLGLSQ